MLNLKTNTITFVWFIVITGFLGHHNEKLLNKCIILCLCKYKPKILMSFIKSYMVYNYNKLLWLN